MTIFNYVIHKACYVKRTTYKVIKFLLIFQGFLLLNNRNIGRFLFTTFLKNDVVLTFFGNF